MASQEAIFGEEGKVTFKSPNTTLNFDATDVTFASDTISFDKTHNFVTGHLVQLLEDASGTLPAGTATATDYYVIVVDDTTISLATSEANAIAGTALTLTDDGTGTGHSVVLQEYDVMASARNWSLNVNKATVDVTTLVSTVRSYKTGLVDGSGSMQIIYEAGDDLASQKARKIFDALLLPFDDGNGSIELYLSTTDVSDADRKLVSNVIFTSFSISNNIGAVVEANVNFQLNGSITLNNIA